MKFAKRGQAFETMMLVISVIVALAILGVLTGILGSLQIGIASSPDAAMHDALKGIVASGFGYSTPQKAVLKKATRLDMRAVIKNDLPELDAEGTNANVRFCVETTELSATVLPGAAACSGNAVTQGSTNLGPSAQDVAFFFVVCGDSSIGQRGGYRIWIGGTAQSAGNCNPPTTQ